MSVLFVTTSLAAGVTFQPGGLLFKIFHTVFHYFLHVFGNTAYVPVPAVRVSKNVAQRKERAVG